MSDPKAKFMAVCERWADLLIGDSVKQVANGGARWQIEPLERMIPRTVGWNGEPNDLPDSQRDVWLAAYQLMLDAYDDASK